jgi:cation/acetate symporter
VLIALSSTVQVDLLHHEAAWFPLKNPALVTIPLSFAVGIAGSLATSAAGAVVRYPEWERRMQLGAIED